MWCMPQLSYYRFTGPKNLSVFVVLDPETHQTMQGVEAHWVVERKDGSPIGTNGLASENLEVEQHEGDTGKVLRIQGIRTSARQLRAKCVHVTRDGDGKQTSERASGYINFDVTPKDPTATGEWEQLEVPLTPQGKLTVSFTSVIRNFVVIWPL